MPLSFFAHHNLQLLAVYIRKNMVKNHNHNHFSQLSPGVNADPIAEIIKISKLSNHCTLNKKFQIKMIMFENL